MIVVSAIIGVIVVTAIAIGIGLSAGGSDDPDPSSTSTYAYSASPTQSVMPEDKTKTVDSTECTKPDSPYSEPKKVYFPSSPTRIWTR